MSKEAVQVDVEKGLLEAPSNNNKKRGSQGWYGVSKGDDGPLTFIEVEERRQQFGLNCLEPESKNACVTLLQSLLHPFNILLCINATLSAVVDELIIMGIMLVIVLISTSIRFYEEWTFDGAVYGLFKLIPKSVSVIRLNPVDPVMTMEVTVPSEELVPGDWVVLRPGELVPADAVVLTSKAFSVSQAPLADEAIPVEKYRLDENPQETEEEKENGRRRNAAKSRRVSLHRPMSKVIRFFRNIFEMRISVESQLDKSGFELKEDLSTPNHVFMGTQVITGMATVRVVRTGSSTLFGRIAEALTKSKSINPFQQGVKRISLILLLMMSVMVPLAWIIKTFWGESWRQACISALSVAVALTPEVFPIFVNGNLMKGCIEMSRKSSIVKNPDIIINLSAVDIICTAKTGTLTKGVVQLSTYLDPYGTPCFIPLEIAYLNSYFQSILQNPLDTAITAFCDALSLKPSKLTVLERESQTRVLETASSVLMKPAAFAQRFSRVDEIPFDYVRRRLSVILKETIYGEDKFYLVCKGAGEEILSVCTHVLKEGYTTPGTEEVFPSQSDIVPLNENHVANSLLQYTQFTEKGERVLAVSFKTLPSTTTSVSSEDESHMIFVGFLSFTDPPKWTAEKAIVDLMEHNIEIKVLTGDSAKICSFICSDIKLPVKKVVTGEELQEAEKQGPETLWQVVKEGTIFAKLTSLQKLLVVKTLRNNKHVVAFMGDGIHDSPSLREADVGICAENGVDICREAANIIFPDKDLGLVVDGIRIGRETYGNTVKYIAMALSANFGNVISILLATILLPYDPMSSLHLVAQNLLYNLSQIAIPWDSTDEKFYNHPHKWRTGSILRFMLWIGPWSSAFDILTFIFMYFYFDIQDEHNKKKVQLFQTAWFTVGLLSQTLIVHMIRTIKIPLIESRASIILTLATLAVMSIGLALPYIVPENLGLVPLPRDFYFFLGAVLVSYCIIAHVAKCIYLKLFLEWF